MKTKCLLFLTVVLFVLASFISITPNGNAATKGGQILKYPCVTVRALIKGAPIYGTNGLYFGPDGNLYVASSVGNEIIKMDPNSVCILDRIGQERGVSGPEDLVFGPDGSLYWTEIGTGEIGKLTSDGNYSTVLSSTSSLAGTSPFDKVKDWALTKAPADQDGNYLWLIKTKNEKYLQKIKYGEDLIYEPEVMYGLGWLKSLNIISVCRGVGIDLLVINHDEIKGTFSKTILGSNGIESNKIITQEEAYAEVNDILEELVEQKVLK
jgi:hypothetical protein